MPGIRVHEIRPGLIQTDMTADVYERYSAQVETGQLSAIRRWGQPEDIARGVAALATGAHTVQHRRHLPHRRRHADSSAVSFF